MTSSPEQDDLRTPFPRVRIGRALVDCCSFVEALDAITRHAVRGGPPVCVVPSNAQHVVLLESDAGLQEAYASAELVLADGVSLLFASHLLRGKLRERVAGVDLFEQLCGKAAELGLRVFFLGGRPGSAQLAAGKLKRWFPRLAIAGSCCPPLGFERDQRELQAVREAIRQARPDIVFVALGAPKQELWMHRHGRQSGVPVVMGVGGSFEIAGGIFPRAPRFVQRMGCEWLYRLLLEPSRLWKRYLIGNCRFLWIVLRQIAGRIRPDSDTSLHAPVEGRPSARVPTPSAYDS